MSEEQKEKKKYEDGTRSVAHLVVESAKYDTAIKKLDGTTFQGARLVCTGKFGSKEIKIAHASLDMPFNAALKKQVKDACDQFKIAFANDEEFKITLETEYNAKSTYWNPKSIHIGFVGQDGIQRSGNQGNQQSGNGGGGYSNEDAQAGQIINIAVAMLQAQAKKGGFDMAAVTELAVSLVDDYKSAKDAVKYALKSKGSSDKSPATPATEPPATQDIPVAAESDEMSFDEDDIPF